MADDQLGELFIKELIRRVHDELYASQQERQEAGEEAIFEVESLTLEVNFVAIKSKEGTGAVDFKVLTAGGRRSYQREQVHKVTMTLSSIPLEHRDDDGASALQLPPAEASRFRPRDE
ncbi:trypco2 family protein [Streptomyces mirabilis]|uniref:trypco2 family protein n=1 Tax=Streptomyces mirabilis TaxID=68239 RepID=UPI0033CC610E